MEAKGACDPAERGGKEVKLVLTSMIYLLLSCPKSQRPENRKIWAHSFTVFLH